MKLSEKLIRVGLILLVGISLYLSYMIWLNPTARNNVTNVQETITNTEKLRSTKENVFLPLRLIWLDGETVRQTNTESFISKIQKVVTEGEYEAVTSKTYDTQEEFNKHGDIAKGIELYYFGPFLLSEYNDAFKMKLNLDGISKGDNTFFTKIQLDLEKHVIRFINSRRRQISEAYMTLDEGKLTDLLKGTKEEWLTMTAEDRLSSLQYNTANAVELKRYSYMASNQSYAVFRDAFFTNPQDVRNNDESSELVLFDGSENMTVSDDKYVVDFRGGLPTDTKSTDIYRQSFEYVSKLGTNLGNLHFFDYSGDQINYRVFVEGYPVFGEDYQGEVDFSLSSDERGTLQQLHLKSNLSVIQVPIPADETVTLPSSQEVLAQLKAKQIDEDKLSAIVIAYQRQAIDNASSVVDLVPMWYLRYDLKWYSYDQLLAKLTEGGN